MWIMTNLTAGEDEDLTLSLLLDFVQSGHEFNLMDMALWNDS